MIPLASSHLNPANRRAGLDRQGTLRHARADSQRDAGIRIARYPPATVDATAIAVPATIPSRNATITTPKKPSLSDFVVSSDFVVMAIRFG
jgi:hypothetical protein